MSTNCRSCHAPIVWARTAFNGTPIPIDRDPTAEGNVVLTSAQDGSNRLVATVLPPGDPRIDVEVTYTSHFATCPDADQFRRRTHA